MYTIYTQVINQSAPSVCYNEKTESRDWKIITATYAEFDKQMMNKKSGKNKLTSKSRTTEIRRKEAHTSTTGGDEIRTARKNAFLLVRYSQDSASCSTARAFGMFFF